MKEKEDKLKGRNLNHRGFDYMTFPIEYPQAEGIVYFFHIDFNLFIPSFFSTEPRSSSEEGAVPVVWELQINRARFTAPL